MKHADINQTNPLSLAHIAEMDGVWHEWTDDELDVMLLHQLGSEIQLDPKFVSGDVARKLMGLAAQGTPVPNRYCDLFRHPTPPIELLEYAKQVAKSARHHPDSPHQKISTVIYYSTIVVALMRCGRRITGLDDGALAFELGRVRRLDLHRPEQVIPERRHGRQRVVHAARFAVALQ